MANSYLDSQLKQKSLHPHVTILKAFTLYIAVLAFPLYSNIKHLTVPLY